MILVVRGKMMKSSWKLSFVKIYNMVARINLLLFMFEVYNFDGTTALITTNAAILKVMKISKDFHCRCTAK